jgi:hypothetical protein
MGVCTVEGCTKHTYYNSPHCPMHKWRMMTHGKLELPVRVQKKTPCVVEGCDRPMRSNGLCNMHRLRLREWGVVGPAEPVKRDGGKGYISRQGYRFFHRPSHPNAMKNGQIAEHIIVMTEMLGRPLRKGETVHHKNGIKADNRPENLELWTQTHPYGQSVHDMVAFCRAYLIEYAAFADHYQQEQR